MDNHRPPQIPDESYCTLAKCPTICSQRGKIGCWAEQPELQPLH